MKVEDGDDLEAMLAAEEARDASVSVRVRELDAEDKPVYKFKSPSGDVIVHKSTRNLGGWQMTYFAPDGTPSGHEDAATRVEALTAAARGWRAEIGEPRVVPRRSRVRKNARTVRLSPTCASVMETDVLDRIEGEEDEFDALRAAWNGSGLVVTAENQDAVARAVMELSNHCDYLGYQGGPSEEERKFYRRAASGFANLKVRK